jgi:hypothetical protein
MKASVRLFFLSLGVSVFLLVPAAFAQSASGAIHVHTDDGTRNIEFNAQVSGSGASGQIKFSAPLTIPNQDVDEDGTGDLELSTTTVSLRIDVDCLRVDGNRASLGGVVTESSVSGYVGRRMLLTVEDGGEGSKAPPDRYTWGQYRSTSGSWTASDAELVFDTGVGLTWIATDAERTDDAGISSVKPTTVTCQSFPLSSYALEDLPQGSGNIQVRP